MEPELDSLSMAPLMDPESTSLKIGTRLQVLKTIDGQQFYHRAEIMSIRSTDQINGGGDADSSAALEYYVHFIDFNKRLDEWVSIERMDLATIEASLPTQADKLKKTPISQQKKNLLKTPIERSTSQVTINTDDRKRGRKRRAPSTGSGSLVEAGGEFARSPSVVSSSSEVASSATTTMGLADAGSSGGGPTAVNGGGLSKAQELEKLRRGGSMTQRLEEVARVKNIDRIQIGQHVVQTWYFSPYPLDLCGTTGDSTIYLCEFCLFYFGNNDELRRHRQKCSIHHPPGTEIYRNNNYSFWELDGHRQKTYCRNLCLLSKLFLDHKTLFYDVDPFLFYVLTENDQRGCHLLGYFSKEKESAENYNVACILTLPQHQRKGYGKFLIEFSYELTKREGKTGSPEKPLSDLGLLSYRSFWSEVLVSILLSSSTLSTSVDNDAEDDGGDGRGGKKVMRPSYSIEQLSRMTGFTCDDILHTLQAMDALRYRKGQHIIVLGEKHVTDHEKAQKKARIKVDPKALNWTPPIFTASQLRFL